MLTALLFAHTVFCSPARAQGASSLPWLKPVPCRVEDGDDADLFVMTLGDVKTPLAQGTFDLLGDAYRPFEGPAVQNYYKNVLGVKYFKPIDKSRFPLPPSGWCTWYFYYSQITADEVKLNAKWIADNLRDYGAKYVQIDDGWQGANRANGGRDWTSSNAKFPGGMSALAKYIKSVGLTPGLWLAPHGQTNTDVVNANPKVFLHKQDGTLDADARRWEGRYLVDPSTPEAQAYMTDLFTNLSKWGFEYFKIDGQPDVVAEYRRKRAQLQNPSEDTEGLYRQTLESIRKAIGPDRYLLGCWGLPIQGVGIFNGSRTGGDIVEGWGGFRVALNATMRSYYLHNVAWYSDPDVMLVRSPMTLNQARAWAALQGLTGQSLMATDRMPDLSKERVDLVKTVYPATDIRPLDLFPSRRNKRIWDLKINHLGRDYDVVGVFNFQTAKPEQTLLRWKDLGLPAGKPVHVFDFWNKEYLGCWDAGLAVDADPTSCRLLSLVPSDGHVQLVSTSRHVTQGWVDLFDLKRNDADDGFAGASHVIKHDSYELRFAFPRGKGLQVKSATAQGAHRNVQVQIFNHQGWAGVEITSPTTQDVKWEVKFGPAPYFHFQLGAPVGLAVTRQGDDTAVLRWNEQYYLNAGYQVYVNGVLWGAAPRAGFTLTGLDPNAEYDVEVRSVWQDGRESPGTPARGARIRFSLKSLAGGE